MDGGPRGGSQRMTWDDGRRGPRREVEGGGLRGAGSGAFCGKSGITGTAGVSRGKGGGAGEVGSRARGKTAALLRDPSERRGGHPRQNGLLKESS